MKAIRIGHFGPPDVQEYVDESVPQPKSGEAIGEVHAAGVGPWDAWMREEKTGQALRIHAGLRSLGYRSHGWRRRDERAPGEAVYDVTNGMFTGAPMQSTPLPKAAASPLSRAL